MHQNYYNTITLITYKKCKIKLIPLNSAEYKLYLYNKKLRIKLLEKMIQIHQFLDLIYERLKV